MARTEGASIVTLGGMRGRIGGRRGRVARPGAAGRGPGRWSVWRPRTCSPGRGRADRRSSPGLYSPPVTDPSIRLHDPDLRSRFLRAIDAEARIPAALQALGPVTDRDVCRRGRAGTAPSPPSCWRWAAGCAPCPTRRRSLTALPDGRADVIVSGWTGFRPGTPEWDDQIAQARRVLRPDGRLLVVHDYGRDEVTRPLG